MEKTTINSKFNIWVPIQTRFCDTDLMGHINNVSYIAYLETARVAYMEKLREVSLKSNILAPFSFILAEIRCTYKSQGFFGEKLEVGLKIREIRKKSFIYEYVIIEKGSGRIIVEAESVQVMYDYFNRKSMEIPDEFVIVAEQLEGRKIDRRTDI